MAEASDLFGVLKWAMALEKLVLNWKMNLLAIAHKFCTEKPFYIF